MIKRIILIYLLILTSPSFGQTINELENDLSRFYSHEKYGDKIETARKLQKIDPFNYVATRYICQYYSDRKIDSISIYFDNLILKFPENAEPYILRSELMFLEFDFRESDEYKKRKIEYLKMGFKINPKDPIIVFKIAEVYYQDFILPLKKEKELDIEFLRETMKMDSTIIAKMQSKKKSTFENSADSSLKYFYQLWELQVEKREIIYYPIRQLECFLNLSEKSPIQKGIDKNFNQCYFPSFYFTNLTEHWECDFTMDYLFEVESGKRTAKSLERQLKNLKEDCLFVYENKPNETIYRFTWLRTFHQPIAIRIENNENKIMLYWKVGKGASGYGLRGLKKSGKKKLSLKEWKEFERLLKESNFDSLPNEKYILMFDGASWTLEKKSFESFKAHDFNEPSKEFIAACLYLLNLTNIKVKEEYIY